MRNRLKIAIYDDLHIETDGAQRFELADADICVLAGDICVAAHLASHRTDADARGHKKACTKFFQRVSDKYRRVFYVMGNHEHYRGVFEQTPVLLRDFLAQWPNITLLEKEGVVYEGVYFYGATLWTSVNNNNPITVECLKGYLNDFTVIKRDGGATWHPTMSYLDHLEALEKLEEHYQRFLVLQDARAGVREFVVITHHCPSELSLDERFKDEVQGNYGYFSNLENFILDKDIAVWFHGHIHVDKDYYLGDTRIVANPRGYPYEIKFSTSGFNERKVVEV